MMRNLRVPYWLQTFSSNETCVWYTEVSGIRLFVDFFSDELFDDIPGGWGEEREVSHRGQQQMGSVLAETRSLCCMLIGSGCANELRQETDVILNNY